MSENARYRFGPLERRGFMFGLRLSQLGTLLAAAITAIVILHIDAGALNVALAFALIAGAAAVSFWNVGGRSLDAWMPLILSHLRLRLRGEHRFVSDAPLLGRTHAAEIPHALPQSLQGLKLLAAPVSGGELGVICDVAAGTYTAALSVRGRSFALLDDDAKQRLLAQWADVLAGLAREGSPVRRVQWIERTVPDPGDAVGQYLREAIALPHQSAAVRSYLQLVEAAGPATQQHETLLVLQMETARARRAVRQSGGGDQGACSVLARELYSLATRLQGAELDVIGMLTPRLLSQALRVAFDPQARSTIAMRNLATPEAAGVAPEQAWPHSTETAWHHHRTDSAVHATFWIAEWPRIDVGPDFLAPLLLQTWMDRTVAVTIEPVPPLRAQRDVEHARVSDLADSEVRRRHGFILSRRREREQENVVRREQELADGHADIRFSGYITVSAGSEEELEVACGEIEQQAGQSRLVLRRMTGEQDVAFTYTLPLGRGLR